MRGRSRLPAAGSSSSSSSSRARFAAALDAPSDDEPVEAFVLQAASPREPGDLLFLGLAEHLQQESLTAQLVRLDRLPVSEAWRLVVGAILSNLVFKLGTVLFLGARQLKVQLSIILTMTIIVGLLLLKFWPA